MCIVFVCVQFVTNFGCHYNQSGLLKIEILILLRLARFQNLGTPCLLLGRTLYTRYPIVARAWPSASREQRYLAYKEGPDGGVGASEEGPAKLKERGSPARRQTSYDVLVPVVYKKYPICYRRALVQCAREQIYLAHNGSSRTARREQVCYEYLITGDRARH